MPVTDAPPENALTVCPHCEVPLDQPVAPKAAAPEVAPLPPPVAPFAGLIPHMPCPATLGPVETLPAAPGAPLVYRRLDPRFGWFSYHIGTAKKYDVIRFHPLPLFEFSMVKLNKVEAQFPDEVTLEFRAVLAYVTFRNGMSLRAFQLTLFYVYTRKKTRTVLSFTTFVPEKFSQLTFATFE